MTSKRGREMNSLILKLQSDLMNQDKKLSEILATAYLIAKKLNKEEFACWIKNEINGYASEDKKDFPQYRQVVGILKGFNPYVGWQYIVIPNKEIEDNFTVTYENQAIGELEELLGYDVEQELYRPLPSKFLSYLSGSCTKAALFFDRNSIKHILITVRQILLDWTLALEKEGILGNEMIFTKEEADKAQIVSTPNVYNITNHFNGNTNYQNEAIHSFQTQINEFDVKQAKDIYELIVQNIDKLDLEQDKYSLLKSELQIIKNELEKEGQNPSIIKQSLQVIKNIIVNAAGNVVGQAILHSLNLLGC